MEFDPNTNTISTTSEGVNIIIVNPKSVPTNNSEITYLDKEEFNQYTGSIQSNLDLLSINMGSYLTQLPVNLISSSEQISNLGFVTECVDLSPLNHFTGSIQLEIENLINQTSSFLTYLPNNLISSSEQIKEYGFITTHIDISPLNDFTGSTQNQIEDINNQLGLFITELPANLISSSEQISNLGFVTECVDLFPLNEFTESISNRVVTLESQTESYLTQLPANLISSSEQISDLGFVTECVDLSPLNDYTSSIYEQITIINNKLESTLTELPTNLVSSSEQISDLGFVTECVDLSPLNDFTGSVIALAGNLVTQINNLRADIGTANYVKGPLVSDNIIDFNAKVLTIINENGINNNTTITPPTSSTTNIGDNITAKTGSFDYLEVNNFTNQGTGVPTISSPTNLILNATTAVVIDDLLQLKGTTIESVSNPINGSIIYDNEQHKFFGYANGTWVAFN
jgi:hypothetical protein